MVYFVSMREGWLRDVGIQKFHCIGSDEGIRLHINDQESAVVFEGQT